MKKDQSPKKDAPPAPAEVGIPAVAVDPLTGLPDRQAFFAWLADQERGPFAIISLDIDDLHELNLQHGHAAGDQILIQIADRLARSLRPQDFVARLGGDEFGVFLGGITGKEMATTVAERLLEELRKPIYLPDLRLDVGVSLGVAIGGRPRPEATLAAAEVAQRQAKERRLDLQPVFADEAGAEIEAFEADLERALENGEFEVLYQPIFSTSDQLLTSVEALIRWNHPTRGTVSPVTFIPIAERSGLIVPIGTWVLQTALSQLKRWNEIMPDLHGSVNLSVRQLEKPSFLDDFRAVLAQTGVTAENVTLEITESHAMDGSDARVAVLNGLAELGVTLAIDDFGTGYSNLSYLQHLPFEVVKIDRGFLTGVPDEQRNTALVRTIITMAQALELGVVAEGVETNTQAMFLYWEGANWVQGFHFSRPVPARVITEQYVKPNAETRSTPV